jgi:hypothetical protein
VDFSVATFFFMFASGVGFVASKQKREEKNN